MLFKDFLGSERIVSDLAASNKAEAVWELAETLFASGVVGLELREGILAALFYREELQSTALGYGLGMAIPHARHPGVRGLIGVLGRSREGIDFDSPDGLPVHLLIMLVSSRDSTTRHLEALAYIIRKFRNREFRNCILKATSREQIADFLDDSDNEE